MKELEDRAEQNRTGILFKAAQRATSCGELDSNKLATLEQLQEVDLINIILYLLYNTDVVKIRNNFEHFYSTHFLLSLFQEKARLSQELEMECNKRATLDAEVTKLRSLVETSETSLVYEKNLVTQLQQEVSQLKVLFCFFIAIYI